MEKREKGKNTYYILPNFSYSFIASGHATLGNLGK